MRQLLTHSSGLVAYGDLYNEISGKKAYLERIQGMELDYEPGTRSVYSDYGMILLGEILERVAGQPMDVFLEERVYGPLGMTDTGFLPADDLLERIAPTEDDPWRGYRVRGEVHDENAHALGGVAPHAGLFSTATDLARFLQMILNGGVFENQRIVCGRSSKNGPGKRGFRARTTPRDGTPSRRRIPRQASTSHPTPSGTSAIPVPRCGSIPSVTCS